MRTFSAQLAKVCPEDDSRFTMKTGPIKKSARIAEKVNEYNVENEGDLSKWPGICKVGDVLRVTICCVDGDAVFLAVQRIVEVFDLRDGNGRLKNMLGTRKHMPPRILINCVVRAANCTPIMAEIQVYLASIKHLADLQHRYYEIRRATGVDALIAEASAPAKPAEKADVNAAGPDEECKKAPEVELSAGPPDVIPEPTGCTGLGFVMLSF